MEAVIIPWCKVNYTVVELIPLLCDQLFLKRVTRWGCRKRRERKGLKIFLLKSSALARQSVLDCAIAED